MGPHMNATRLRVLAVLATMGSLAASAEAQSAPTCTFDPAIATVTVTVNGIAAEIRASATNGTIRLNGVACGAATVHNTDSILIDGGQLDDHATVSGRFAPGLTSDGDGASEIEIAFALGLGEDTATVKFTNAPDRVTFTSGGIDVGEDGDEDIDLAHAENVEIDGLSGGDIINAAAFLPASARNILTTYGGDGNDRLVGNDANNNYLVGGPGDDLLFGRGGSDWFVGGPGNDSMFGGDGRDYFVADPAIDGADFIEGGRELDTLDYRSRTNGITVTLGNGLADDGEPGEGDLVERVEEVWSGSGDDVLVGSSGSDYLYGRDGADEIYGGAGDDALYGEDGADSLFGEDGDDALLAGPGPDVLTGGPGADRFFAQGGGDIIFNADGFADYVNCGPGEAADDAEEDPLDTFIGCEL